MLTGLAGALQTPSASYTAQRLTCHLERSQAGAFPDNGRCRADRKRARAVIRHATNYEGGKRLKQAAQEYAEGSILILETEI